MQPSAPWLLGTQTCCSAYVSLLRAVDSICSARFWATARAADVGVEAAAIGPIAELTSRAWGGTMNARVPTFEHTGDRPKR